MNNEIYKKTLQDIKACIDKTTQPIKYIDTAKLSRKQKDVLIIELQDKIHNLERESIIRKSINDRFINGLIQSKYDEVLRLINNPILTLPSGMQIEFNSLSSEQLEYLESLNIKGNKMY